MCGISGIFSINFIDPKLVPDSIEKISHRGPDETGFFQSQNCVLGICRLSIIDVSSGQQPSYNQEKTVASVFNGEIYNFGELRERLISRGHRIGGLGDSALIPFLYQEFGDQFPRQIQGMFAIALYDSRKSKLLLARDRIGKKPLWYSWNRETISFSSEVKGLLSLGVERSINESVIPEFLQYGYINAPRSAFNDIEQLPPASILVFEDGKRSVDTYWNISDTQELSISFPEAKEEAKRLIRQAVRTRLVSERPIGSFLSGGIDSTIVTALMKEESEGEVNTYSIGFSESKYDESGFARNIANELGTKHHERFIKADPTLIVETLSKALDQPFADSSIIPTYLLAKFASEDLVVALSGDGGDEAFGGYDRYRAGKMLNAINPLLVLNPLRFLPADRSENQKLRKLIRNSDYQSLENRYRGFQFLFTIRDLHSILNPDLLSKANADDFSKLWSLSSSSDNVRKMQEIDIRTYLPGDLMHKVDMASMANSIEVRSPLLDYRVVEFGISLPSKFKIGAGENKHILREIARDFVPRKLIDRPKKGFGIPQAEWLREDLVELVKDVLLDEKSRSRGWYQFKKVEELIKLHNSGRQLDNLIWPMLMLELWAKNWID